MISERYLDKLFKTGRFGEASLLCREKLSEATSNSDRIHFNDMLQLNERNLSDISRLGIGEAFFPVFDKAEKTGFVYTIKIKSNKEIKSGAGSDKENDPDFSSRLNYSKDNKLFKVIENFISNLGYFKTFVPLNYGWDLFSVGIKKLPVPADEHTPVITGTSLELAFVMATFSTILKKPIKNIFAFTGSVDREGNVSKIDEIGINGKIKGIERELPSVKILFIPESNATSLKNYDQSKIKIVPVEDIYQVIKHVFPDFHTTLKKIIKFEKLGSDWISIKKRKDKIHVLKLDTSRKHKPDVPESCIPFKVPQPDKGTKGLILDGPYPQFLSTFLCIQYCNQFSLLAMSLGPSDDALVVVTKGKTEKKIGQRIKFRNKL